MSKSYGYALPLLKDRGFSENQVREKSSEPIFDKFMNGCRERTASTPYGNIHIIIEFNRNGTFDCAQPFYMQRDGYIKVEDALGEIAESVLMESGFKVSSQEDVDNLQDGDTLKITIGNFIIGEIINSENSKITQTVQIVLPSKHEVIKNHE